MTIRKFTVPAVSDGAQVGTFYTPYVSGWVASITYVKTDYTNGVDFTITVEGTAETVWTEVDVNAGKTVYPRAQTHSTAGVASVYAAAGTAVNDRIAVSRDRIKIVLAQAGANKIGAFIVVIDDGR